MLKLEFIFIVYIYELKWKIKICIITSSTAWQPINIKELVLQITGMIDDLDNQIKARKGQYGTSVQSAKMTSQAFVDFHKTLEVININ